MLIGLTNTHLKLTKALDRFDLVGKEGLVKSEQVKSKVMVGFTSDWLYTQSKNRCIAESLQKTGKDASYIEIDHTTVMILFY